MTETRGQLTETQNALIRLRAEQEEREAKLRADFRKELDEMKQSRSRTSKNRSRHGFFDESKERRKHEHNGRGHKRRDEIPEGAARADSSEDESLSAGTSTRSSASMSN